MKELTQEQIKFTLAIFVLALIFTMIILLFFFEPPRDNVNLINTAMGFAAGWASNVFISYFKTDKLVTKVEETPTEDFKDGK